MYRYDLFPRYVRSRDRDGLLGSERFDRLIFRANGGQTRRSAISNVQQWIEYEVWKVSSGGSARSIGREHRGRRQRRQWFLRAIPISITASFVQRHSTGHGKYLVGRQGSPGVLDTVFSPSGKLYDQLSPLFRIVFCPVPPLVLSPYGTTFLALFRNFHPYFRYAFLAAPAPGIRETEGQKTWYKRILFMGEPTNASTLP